MRGNANDSGGYRGAALRILNDAGASVGDTITIATRQEGIAHVGIVMPRYEHGDETHIVLKLKSGYNVGVDIRTIRGVATTPGGGRRADGGGKVLSSPSSLPSSSSPGQSSRDTDSTTTAGRAPKGGAKRILLLSTGGTIASRIDYRTGAVTPVLSADDLLEAVPELGGMAAIDSEVVTSEYSENIMPEHWLRLARRIAERAGPAAARAGASGGGGGGRRYNGIIVAHGTDTMHYTSAFLSFALAGLPTPIVLVGAQRSSDRASSDAAANLAGAARFITSCGRRGVYVAMHRGPDDDVIACHAGTRVRKNHTSRRDAFQTVGGDPAFLVSPDGITETGGGGGRPDFYGGAAYSPRIHLDERVALVKYYPGYDPGLLDHMIDAGCRAIIFEGTGLGHVGRAVYRQVARAADSGIFLGMTSQCIDGRIAMTVYESGRDLMGMGVVALGNMIPEVALVKAMWAAGVDTDVTAEGIREAMLSNIASEVTAH